MLPHRRPRDTPATETPMATSSTFADNEPESVTHDEATTPQLYLALESERPWAGGLRVSLANAREVEIRRGNKRECVFETEARKLVVTLPDPRVSSSHAAPSSTARRSTHAR
jgi:hypothetical protein